MAHSFWLECVSFYRSVEHHQNVGTALEAVEQDLRSLLQWPEVDIVERVGQELAGEWATLAHLIASLAICGVNHQVR
jgi:hypothetical protein